MTDDRLTEWRKQIDTIDDKILHLLKERIDVVKQVGEYKAERGIPFLVPERKQMIIKTKGEQAKQLDLYPEFVEKIYELIHDLGLKTEEEDNKGNR